MIRPYLGDIINDHKTQGEWKVYSGKAVIDIYSKNSDEALTMHTKSNNIEIMMGNETNEIIKELFKPVLQKYQEGLEESMKGSELAFDSVDLLHYKLHKIYLNRDGSYIDSPEWLENKKATINPKNKDGKCFQYALTVAVNYQNI